MPRGAPRPILKGMIRHRPAPRRIVPPKVALCLGALAAALLVLPALAADGPHAKGPSEATFVLQIVLLLVVGRLGGELMQRIGQPAVVGQLLAGIVLGPSVFGALLPGLHDMAFPHDPAQKSLIDGVGQLGVLLLLLLTGMETDVALVRRVGRAAASVSVTGVAVPFACGVSLGLFGLPDAMLPRPDQRVVTALFLGTALSISSIKIVAMVVREMNFMRRDLGQVIVASAIVDDTIGWIIIAITFGLARPGGLDALSLAVSVLGTVAFLVLAYGLGRRAVSMAIRWANDRLVSEFAVLTLILVLMGASALTTDLIGVHTVLGAFVAGVLVGESPILTRPIEDQLRGLVTGLFAPVFFGLAGLGTDLGLLADPRLLVATLALIAIASLGKFGGAFLGGRLGGLSGRQCLALALGMNARGSTEVIVASIGLSLGVLDTTLFSMIVAMAVLTTMAMPPTLRWALARLPLGPEEARRLEREAFEAKDFVAGLERLLVVADARPSGRLASRLAGILGGRRGLPTTVMRLGGDDGAEAAPDALAEAAESVRTGARGLSPSGAEVPDGFDVESRPLADLAAPDGIAAEAAKGYDLTLLGVEPAEAPDGGFSDAVAATVRALEGPTAVVVARGPHHAAPLDAPLRMLVPVTGSQASRHAAELAFALARPTGAAVTVLYVARRDGEPDGADPDRRRSHRALAADIFRDIDALAEQNGVRVRKAVVSGDATAPAIVAHARRALQTVIVLGVGRRPGGAVLFGQTARALLDAAPQSLVFVAT